MSKKNLENRVPLFSTLFGSRLYGTSTPQSDRDWKEVYLPDLNQLLVGIKQNNIVVSTGSDRSRNTKDDEDLEYIPIQVFARDFLEGQTYALEMAFAVLSENYLAEQKVHDPRFVTFVEELVERFLTSNVRSMIGYALNQAQIYGIKGTRLKSVKKFATRLFDGLAVGEYTAEDKLEVLLPWVKENSDKYLFDCTYENVGVNYPGISLLEKIYPTSITISEAITRTENLIRKYGSRAIGSEQANGVDWKATSHALRISRQAVDLLTTKRLVFPFDAETVKILLEVKRGERSRENVEAMLTEAIEAIDQAKSVTTLQEKTEELKEEFDKWLVAKLREFYNL